MTSLALDHITVVDTNPIDLAETAYAVGCDAICLFMESMDVLPLMPSFDIYGDRAARKMTKTRMDDLGVKLDLAYPFTLAGRTVVSDFKIALECAAELDAGLLNVLIYDRDTSRRESNFASFCELAMSFGLRVAVEFYPVSQIRSLADALHLIAKVDRLGKVGVNADLLHLMRSGGSIAELEAAPAGAILYGQFCDGPATCLLDELDLEASSQRLLPGAGVFDIAGFFRALPDGCPVSIEVPRSAEVRLGVPRLDRAKSAVEAVLPFLRAD